MVRTIPFYSHPTPAAWRPHSQGFPAAMMKAQADDQNATFSRIPSRFPVTCRVINRTDRHLFGIFYGESPLHTSFTLVLLEIALVILISRAVRFILKPLKQPRVVSEIIGGIIIGPSVLGRSKKFKDNVFPENAIFLVKNFGVMAFMYFLFVSGVKMDLGLIRKSGRKQWFSALFGVLIPILAVSIVSIILHKSLDSELAKVSSIGAVASASAITAFPVLFPILKDLNLLSSEVGRHAMSLSIIGDAMGINAIIAFEAAKQAEVKGENALWYMISLVLVGIIIVFGVRRVMAWIIHKTPEGKPVEQGYIVAILVGVLVIGFLTDMFGIAIANGPLWLGLAIPDGPPLGATLVERSETIIMEIFMPFAFAFVGLYTDVDSMSAAGWSSLKPLFFMALTGYLARLVATLLSSLYFKMTLRDGLTLSFIMSLRGEVEILIFIHWIDKKIIGLPSFTMMVLLTLTITAITTPLISILYDPTRPYMVNKRRTIQHTPPNTDLNILVCIYDQECVSGIINLLELSNPNTCNPFVIFALRLIDLIGRAAPVLIDHEQQEEYLELNSSNPVHNAFKIYQETKGLDVIKVYPFTAVSPQRSMYQDICKLALVNKATLIILPFDKGNLLQSLNWDVLAHAPCSVAILVDKFHLHNNAIMGSFRRSYIHHFAVLFLGGADAREALVIADRMAQNPDVSITVIRFLSYNYVGDDEKEKKLDDGVVTWFWVKNEANEQVVYKEVVVKNGAETVAAIQAMNDDFYDLWIVGRKQGINPVLLEGLSDWSENLELGVIGDYVSAMDFGGMASVLVVQQQVLRGQGMTITGRPQLQRLACINIC